MPRRKSITGQRVHVCCVCKKEAPWSKGWSWYGSYKQIDDDIPIAKFCSAKCKKAAGPHATNIHESEIAAAHEREHSAALKLIGGDA